MIVKTFRSLVSYLKGWLPELYTGHVCCYEEVTALADHTAFDATVRLAVSTPDQVKEWVQKLNRSSGVTWRLRQTRPTLGRYVLYKVRVVLFEICNDQIYQLMSGCVVCVCLFNCMWIVNNYPFPGNLQVSASAAEWGKQKEDQEQEHLLWSKNGRNTEGGMLYEQVSWSTYSWSLVNTDTAE